MKNETIDVDNKPLKNENKNGSKPLILRKDQIFNMSKVGCTVKEIAKILRASYKTIEEKYSEDIRRGHSELSESIKRTQVKLALAGNVTMLIWVGKQYCGQRDSRHEVEHKADISINVRNFGGEKESIDKYKPGEIVELIDND